MANRIIIDIQDDTPIHQALDCVKQVVYSGRISETTKGIKHFCWCSTFQSGITVLTRIKKKDQTSDSFVVYKFFKDRKIHAPDDLLKSHS